MRNRIMVAACLLVALVMPGWAGSAPAMNDGFDPNANGTVRAIATQADGKILVGGEFTNIGRATFNRIARLNINGTTDTTFSATGANDAVLAIAVQSDGRIVVGGRFTRIAGAARNRVARLNADGSLDAAFNPGSGANDTVNAVAVQADGRVLVGGSFTAVNGSPRFYMARLNANGTLDTTYVPAPYANANSFVNALAVQPNGRTIIGGAFDLIYGTPRNLAARLRTDGSQDVTYRTSPDSAGQINAIALQADGKAVVGGTFTAIDGMARNRVARLNGDGSLDTAFDPGTGADAAVRAVAVQPDGRILIGGEFAVVNGQARSRVARLGENGALESAFSTAVYPGNVYALVVQADGGVLLGGDFTSVKGIPRNRLARLNADGTLDVTFRPYAGGPMSAAGTQPDGKILLGGNISGPANYGIVRLNIDGSTDYTFNSGNPVSGDYSALALQPDGKIVINVDTNHAQGPTRNYIKRINANGSLDTSFSTVTINKMTSTGWCYANLFTIQRDGKILIAGAFSTVNSNPLVRNGIVRVNADGTVDPNFNPYVGGGSRVGLYALALQPDGKIVVGGEFTSINGTARDGIGRLNPDGTLDTSFNVGSGIAGGYISSVALQLDGKIIAAGEFASFNGTDCKSIVRLNADGSVDPGFSSTAYPEMTKDIYYSNFQLQSNGKVVICGAYMAPGVNDFINRLGGDGLPDADFTPILKILNGGTFGMALQPDGKILLVGNCVDYAGGFHYFQPRIFNPDAALQKLTVAAGGSAVTWTLGGSFPVPYQVLFESSADGTAWSPLGWGSPVAGVGYRLAGLQLRANADRYVRATGYVNSGAHNGSVSLHRAVLRYQGDTARNAAAGWMMLR